MHTFCIRTIGTISVALLTCVHTFAGAPPNDHLQLIDVFKIEHVSDPQVSPDGKQVVYVRNFMDIMKDKPRSHLWIINVDGSGHRPVPCGDGNQSSPRWSPDGSRLLYISDASGSFQIYCRWMEKGETAQLTRLTSAPVSPVWSPDGKTIAFGMLVEEPEAPFVQLPAKPEGAEWAAPSRVIRKVTYRSDGKGYLKNGYYQLFVAPAEGGTPRQLTRGPYHHLQASFPWLPLRTPSWAPDGKAILLSGNRHADAEYEPLNTEVYEVSVADGATKALTDRMGPDDNPVVSPDGKHVAYYGFNDERLPYQLMRFSLMNRDGTGKLPIGGKLDREVQNPIWSKDGSGLYLQYTDTGNNKIGFLNREGSLQTLAENVGGTELARPYSSGSFSVGGDGTASAHSWVICGACAVVSFPISVSHGHRLAARHCLPRIGPVANLTDVSHGQAC